MKNQINHMTISPETHILVGDIAFRMGDECDRAWKENGDVPSNLAAGWLYCEGLRQHLEGISKGMDEMELFFSQTEGRERRRTMAKVAATH